MNVLKPIIAALTNSIPFTFINCLRFVKKVRFLNIQPGISNLLIPIVHSLLR